MCLLYSESILEEKLKPHLIKNFNYPRYFKVLLNYMDNIREIR